MTLSLRFKTVQAFTFSNFHGQGECSSISPLDIKESVVQQQCETQGYLTSQSSKYLLVTKICNIC